MTSPIAAAPRMPSFTPSPEARIGGDDAPSSGGRLVSRDGREMALRSTEMHVTAAGGVARVVLAQRFANPHAEPLSVTYQLPLPADAAVSGFSFTVDDLRIVGEVDRKHAARERFEQALIEGKTAALLEQERSSFFTQEVGNIPPGADLLVEIELDQRLVFLPEGAWEWRFPTVIGPRYLGEAGRVADAKRLVLDVLAPAAPGDAVASGRPRASLALSIGDAIASGLEPSSPSHALSIDRTAGPAGGAWVRLADEGGVRLDRDVVVRWPVGAPRVGLSLQTARPAASSKHGAVAYGLLTIVPPSPEARGEAVARDLIVLVDTSGSMGGRPLEQAAQVVSALVEGLTPRDRIELISFDSQPRRWRRGPVEATPEVRRDAVKWLKGLRAGGSTEMRTGIVEALRPLRAGAQRQIILVTDGYVGFEREIVETLHAHLPRGSRLHTIGVGSAVNRSLTGPAARAGRGVEVVVGLDEDPTEGARRLVARTFAPLVTDVVIDGDAVLAYAPAAMPDLFAGAPVLASLKLRPEGGSLRVRGSTAAGEWSQAIVVPPTAAASGSPAVVALYGREAVEDLETCWAMGNDAPRIDAEIERIGLAFQIATRLTSWVAVAHTPAVDPRTPRRHEDIAHELPHGMSIEGLGLRSTGSYAPPQPAPIGGFAPWGGALTQSGYMAPAAMARASAPLQPQVARRAADEGASMSSMFAPMAPAQAKRAGRPWAWALLLLVLVLLVGFVAYLLASRPTTRAGVDGLRRDDGLFAALDGLAASRPSLVDAFVAARGACQRAPRGRASLG